MGAEKIVKINNDYEVESLKNKVEVYESVIGYSVAEQMINLQDKVRELEDEAIALRTADSTKDKLIAEKDKRIDTMQKSYETQLANKLKLQEKQFEAEKAQSLMNQRKNIRAKEVKPEKEKVEAANKERDRIQQMYESLLSEFKQVNEKLDTQTGLLYTILDIVSSSNDIDEAKEEINELKTNLGIQDTTSRKPSKKDKIAFTELVNSLSINGMTNKEIASKLYSEGHPFMITVATENAREQKVGRYLHKEYK